ncbi:unnamed protein product [Cuscuta campestris]|uniref:Uncharacterized protein n=1 Tax=Cuscuta campestris TaxID=132261 RepID=A0A484KV05_9ASTE|nr:unnamed protein product [Cuscuta campestris]
MTWCKLKTKRQPQHFSSQFSAFIRAEIKLLQEKIDKHKEMIKGAEVKKKKWAIILSSLDATQKEAAQTSTVNEGAEIDSRSAFQLSQGGLPLGLQSHAGRESGRYSVEFRDGETGAVGRDAVPEADASEDGFALIFKGKYKKKTSSKSLAAAIEKDTAAWSTKRRSRGDPQERRRVTVASSAWLFNARTRSVSPRVFRICACSAAGKGDLRSEISVVRSKSICFSAGDLKESDRTQRRS